MRCERFGAAARREEGEYPFFVEQLCRLPGLAGGAPALQSIRVIRGSSQHADGAGDEKVGELRLLP